MRRIDTRPFAEQARDFLIGAGILGFAFVAHATGASLPGKTGYWLLDGPLAPFLVLACGLSIGALALGGGLEWLARGRADEADADDLRRLEPFELACLAGGEDASVEAPLAALVHAGAARVAIVGRVVETTGGALPREAGRGERAVVALLAGRALTVEALARRFAERLAPATRLRELGLVLPRETALEVRGVTALAALAPLALVLVRGVVGLGRGERPEPLLLPLVVGLWALRAGWRLPHRTARGDRALRGLRAENALLGKLEVGAPGVSSREVALAAGLFGSDVLRGGNVGRLRVALTPTPGQERDREASERSDPRLIDALDLD